MKTNEIYRCSGCGMLLEVTSPGDVQNVQAPFCCGGPMVLQIENSVDAAREKHVPVVEACEDGILVKIGEVPHPMTEDHYIQWIEVINGSYVNRCYLKPGDLPQAAFYVPLSPKLIIRESCNIHGLWKKP
ncbi:MAG: desulfoferrodoxin [Lentisphaerae bacterium]|nr:desulfoferrodoxin [Lentisphaerota bacterium]